MSWLSDRFSYLFRSTRGLILVNIALISLVTAFFGTLSGPMREWGISDWMIRTVGFRLVEAEREARIILLYHTIAIAVVALEVYIITAIIPMRRHEQLQINATMTFGYIITLVFGLWFGYFGHNFVFHGIYLFGLSLSFFAGLLLAAALWPWRKEHRTFEKDVARTKGGVSLERLAFFAMTMATLGSALFGAVTGSYWGQGHETFLAEDILREPTKSALQLAIIGHLHIMLTMIAVALALIIAHWFDFRGRLQKIGLPLMIVGTIIITLGVWMVVPFEGIAHTFIYVGSMPILLAALLLVIFGWRKLIRQRLASLGVVRASFGQRVSALIHDPLKFGVLWQMVFMNFVVTLPGIYMAVNLDEIFRVWPLRDERIVLTGHWHILAGIIATILLLYYGDMVGLRGWKRQLFGWAVVLFSDLAFAAVMLFAVKRLFVTEAQQGPLASLTILLADVGLMSVLVVLAALMVWRLVDLFRSRGRWRQELAAMETSEPEQEVLS
jgi:hypothetical protein